MTAPQPLPPDSDDSRRLRAKLVSTWWAEQAVLDTLGITALALNDLLAKRGIIAAWHKPKNSYFYPPFQFHGHRIAPQIPAIMTHLKTLDGANGWGEIEWLYGCHSLLDGQRPMDVFMSAPDRVLAVAKREFVDELESGW